jgi:hypothetical protein
MKNTALQQEKSIRARHRSKKAQKVGRSGQGILDTAIN